jgi:hypothetical protein
VEIARPAGEGRRRPSWARPGGAYGGAWNVGTGAREQTGTFDMMGDLWEWNETPAGLSVCGVTRGRSYYQTATGLSSSSRISDYLTSGFCNGGLPIAATVPEPATLSLPALGLGALVLRRELVSDVDGCASTEGQTRRFTAPWRDVANRPSKAVALHLADGSRHETATRHAMTSMAGAGQRPAAREPDGVEVPAGMSPGAPAADCR